MDAGVYIDSGILLKLYATESNSAEADALVFGFAGTLPLTHLQELEICNALRLKVGRGELTKREAALALGDFQADIEAGRYHRPEYSLGAVFTRASRLSQTHASQTKCRSLDLLHVATALEIDSRVFASFDERQRRVAAAEGLQVHP